MCALRIFRRRCVKERRGLPSTTLSPMCESVECQSHSACPCACRPVAVPYRVPCTPRSSILGRGSGLACGRVCGAGARVILERDCAVRYRLPQVKNLLDLVLGLGLGGSLAALWGPAPALPLGSPYGTRRAVLGVNMQNGDRPAPAPRLPPHTQGQVKDIDLGGPPAHTPQGSCVSKKHEVSYRRIVG